MQHEKPKLRGQKPSRESLYPLGDFPEWVIHKIAKRLVFLSAVGNADISGGQWAWCFAEAIDGESHNSNLDACDVSRENCAWSLKTAKFSKPFSCHKVRLISGRNSPQFSAGISDASKDPQKTGNVVLDIWNERVNRVMDAHDEYRLLALVRNMNTMQFAMFEEEISRFVAGNYRWKTNKNNNLVGQDAATGEHRFTWQPHGGQFTIIKQVPASAVKFEIKHPPTIDFDEMLQKVKFDKSWIKIL